MGVAQVIFHFDKITSTLEISTSWGFYECYSIQIRKVDLAGFLVQSIFACSISFKFCKRNIRAHTSTAFLSHCINFATCTTTFNLNNLILQNTYITIHSDSHDKLQLSKKIKTRKWNSFPSNTFFDSVQPKHTSLHWGCQRSGGKFLLPKPLLQ